jgi:ABC-2 type transport system permease protein
VIISVETVQEKVSRTLLHLYMLNPLAVVFQQFRYAMITHDTVSVGRALGSWTAVLEPLAIVFATFILGFWVFNRSAPLVAENL